MVCRAALPNGVTSVYDYDAAGRLYTLKHQAGPQVQSAFTYTVDAAGNRLGASEYYRLASNAAAASRGSVASGALSSTGTRSSLTSLVGGSAVLPFTRGGARTTQAEIEYTYDGLYRLTRADYADSSYFAYDYDAVGNILTKTVCLGGAGCTPDVTAYTYDAANRLASVDGVTYTWDANGNLLHDGVYTYTYDAANRLTGVNDGTMSTSFGYNGLGDRVTETAAGVVTTYTLDLNAGLTQVLADGTNTYLYGQGRIAQYAGTDVQYFLGDGLGSVRQLTDSAGAVTLARSYEPYGETLSSSGAGATNYGFTGEWTTTVADTALLYLRARW